MKKELNFRAFMLMAISLFASGIFISCSGDDEYPYDLKDWKWKKIVRSNINEAQYIFSTPDVSTYSASSRTSRNSSAFGAIDVNGMIKDIQFFNEDGELIDSHQPTIIHGIADVSSDYVICGITLFQDIRYEMEEEDEEIREIITTKSLFCNLLINKNTGVVYMFPNKYDNEAWRYEPSNSLINWYYGIKAYSDAKGNLYMAYYSDGKAKISKINIQDSNNISIEDYLSSAEMDNLLFWSNGDWNFMINASGVCLYETRSQQDGSSLLKLKCPNGRIYPIEQLIPDEVLYIANEYEYCSYHLFLGYNGNYYIATIKYSLGINTIRIYKLSEPTSNEIVSEEVAQLSTPKYITFITDIKHPISNSKKQTHIWILGGNIFEFSEKENTIIDTEIDIKIQGQNPNTDMHDILMFYTSGKVYIGNSGFQRLTQMSLNDYSNQKIIDFQQAGYEAYTISSSTELPELSFTGLRYTDANYIIGIVDDNTGNINCMESTAPINEKTILIRMN